MTSILIIEDEFGIRDNLQLQLEFAGFDVFVAANGEAGFALACEHHPDLIICDIMMPKCDGYQVLEMVRSKPAIAAIPFIFLTARADRSDLRHGMTLGADDYLTKPFTTKEVLAAINLSRGYTAHHRKASIHFNPMEHTSNILCAREALRYALAELISHAVGVSSGEIHMQQTQGKVWLAITCTVVDPEHEKLAPGLKVANNIIQLHGGALDVHEPRQIIMTLPARTDLKYAISSGHNLCTQNLSVISRSMA